MSERLLTTPYAYIFREIEQAAASAPMTFGPAEGYELFDDSVIEFGLDPKIYFMMALTSGGYGRDESLTAFDIVQKNCTFAARGGRVFLDQFPQLDASDMVLPSELGKVKGWNQADYLLFFFYLFAGAKPTTIHEVDRRIRSTGVTNAPSFTGASETRKYADYQELVRTTYHAFEGILKEYGHTAVGVTNIQASLFMNDPEKSFGTRAEGEFMKRIGIPPQTVHINQETLVSADEVYRIDRERLSGLGAAVLGSAINPPRMQFLGVMKGGDYSPNFASKARFRKTGLANLLGCEEYYAGNPDDRPMRHKGNTQISSSVQRELVQPALLPAEIGKVHHYL